jgi:hypothetical protein
MAVADAVIAVIAVIAVTEVVIVVATEAGLEAVFPQVVLVCRVGAAARAASAAAVDFPEDLVAPPEGFHLEVVAPRVASRVGLRGWVVVATTAIAAAVSVR